MGDCPSPSSRSWWMEGECQSLMCLMAWSDIEHRACTKAEATTQWLSASIKTVFGALVVPLLPAVLRPVVRKAVNANPGFKVKRGFDFTIYKSVF